MSINLSIVVPNAFNLRIADAINGLGQHFHVRVFGPPELESVPFQAAVKRLYQPVAATGQFINLEEDLAGSDAVIVVDEASVPAFQGTRAAMRMSIPSFVLSSRSDRRRFADAPNLQKLRFDVLNCARQVWSLSEAGRLQLLGEGVTREVVSIRPKVSKTFQRQVKAGQKFRQYLGISPEALVVVHFRGLERAVRPDAILRAMAHRRLRSRVRSKIHALFVGNGNQADSLKYTAADLGLGAQVMFLHQDPTPFIGDLLNACDLFPLPGGLASGLHEFPIEVLEAKACGVIPLLKNDGEISAVLGDIGIMLNATTDEALALSFEMFAQESRHQLEQLKEECSKEMASIEDSSQALAVNIRKVIAETQATRSSPASLFSNCQHAMDQGQWQEARQLLQGGRVEELLPIHASTFWRMSGDIARHFGEGDLAGEAYANALKYDDRNWLAYRGLGFLAWSQHQDRDAVTYFRRAQALNPQDSETLLGLALGYERLSDLEAALLWLEKCLQAGENRLALTLFIQMVQRCSNRQYALGVCERVYDLIGDYQPLTVAFGRLLIATGDQERGEAMVARAVECPKNQIEGKRLL